MTESRHFLKKSGAPLPHRKRNLIFQSRQRIAIAYPNRRQREVNVIDKRRAAAANVTRPIEQIGCPQLARHDYGATASVYHVRQHRLQTEAAWPASVKQRHPANPSTTRSTRRLFPSFSFTPLFLLMCPIVYNEGYAIGNFQKRLSHVTVS